LDQHLIGSGRRTVDFADLQDLWAAQGVHNDGTHAGFRDGHDQGVVRYVGSIWPAVIIVIRRACATGALRTLLDLE
jgi:hypothetical protein